MQFRILSLAIVSFLSILTSMGAMGTAQRTFVASTGSDANPCSIAAPCRGFARAITQTSDGGEVIVVDSAGYGPVTITQSVSIVAPAGIYAGISVFAGDGVTIDAPNATVVLRGLSINGQSASSGSGVNSQHVARLRIESCVISNMGVNGVLHSARAARIIVLDTIVRDNGASGIGGDADAYVILDHVRSEHNGTNGFYMASLVFDASATISDSVFVFNSNNGVWVASTGSGKMLAQVERSVMSENEGAGIKVSGAGAGIAATVTRSAINDNLGFGVTVSGLLVRATISENAFVHVNGAIIADGATVDVHASANKVTGSGPLDDFTQANGANFVRYGDNVGVTHGSGVFTLVTPF